jgi:hypothetical protein
MAYWREIYGVPSLENKVPALNKSGTFFRDYGAVTVICFVASTAFGAATSRCASEQAVPSSDRKIRIVERRSMAVLLMRVVLVVF